jgi:glutamine synthetase adenylyltransferase
VKSRSCKIDNLSVGDVAIIVNVSRKSITKYLEGSMAMLSHLEKLNLWRKILKDYSDQYDNVSGLVSRLDSINQRMKLGGSAENYNVLRWLHDDMMLAPDYNNLMMVLALEYPKEELSHIATSILSARKLILKAKNRLDRAIENKVAEMIGDSHTSLEDSFTIEVQGIEVRGKKNEIVGIEKRSDLKIEYHSTMKFLK